MSPYHVSFASYSPEEFGLTEEEIHDDEFVLQDEMKGGGMDRDYDDENENYGDSGNESDHESDDERNKRSKNRNKPK